MLLGVCVLRNCSGLSGEVKIEAMTVNHKCNSMMQDEFQVNRLRWPTYFALILPLFPLLVLAAPADVDSTPVSVSVNHDDGGKKGVRHMETLLIALNQEGCNAVLHDPALGTPAQLLFDSRPVSVAEKERLNYQLIARAKTLDGELSVRGALLMHASAASEDLSRLKDEEIAFVGKGSWIGFHLPAELLKDAGVTEHPETFHMVGSHVGTVSMLLHKDSFVAVTAEPLARRWAGINNLSIIAVTDEVETGGWWMERELSQERIQRCARALSRLDRSRLKALPAWIDGFKIVVK